MSRLTVFGAFALALLASAPVQAASPSNFIEADASQYPKFSPALYSSTKPTIKLLVSDDCGTCAAAKEQLRRLAPNHPGLQFVIILDNKYVYSRAFGFPLLDALTLGDLWISLQLQDNRSDQEVEAFLSAREAFGKKEFAAQAHLAKVQKAADRALSPQKERLSRLQAEIKRYERIFKPVITKLNEQVSADLDDFTAEEKAAGSVEQKKAVVAKRVHFAIAHDQLRSELAKALNALTHPVEVKINIIKRRALGKLDDQLRDAKIALGDVVWADRHDAWKTRQEERK